MDEEITRELQSLRQRRGISEDRLSDCPLLRETLRMDNTQAYSLILDTIMGMGNDIEVEALRCAYGIDINPRGTLTTRRQRFSEEHGGRHYKTIENYENIAIAELKQRLLRRKDDVFYRKLGGDTLLITYTFQDQYKLESMHEHVSYDEEDIELLAQRIYGPKGLSLLVPCLIYTVDARMRPISDKIVVMLIFPAADAPDAVFFSQGDSFIGALETRRAWAVVSSDENVGTSVFLGEFHAMEDRQVILILFPR